MTDSERGDLIVAEDPGTLAQRVADRVVDEARFAIMKRGIFHIALAGGTTPKAAYEILAARPTCELVAWKDVRFYFGDERCVPPDDEQSNYRMARLAMLEPLAIPAEHVFRMRGEDDPAAGAAAYAGVLREELGALPVFDLIMLGMGPDGHTASLFPGNPLPQDDRLVDAPWVEKFNTFRLTLTPRVINAARAVIVSTEGDAKADALHAALEGPYDPAQTPIQIVRPQDGDLTWYVDRAAAAKLANRGN